MTTSSRWTLLGSLSLVAALAVGVMGCQQEGSTGASSEASESTEAAAQPLTTAQADATPTEAVKAGREHRGGFRRHGPPGPEGLLFAAMHELTLSDAQKTAIQGAIDSLRPSDSERPARDASPFKALAASVRAGKIDTSALPARDTNVEARFAAHRTKITAALTTLHDTLTAEQRTTLVAAVQAKMDEHGARREAPDAGEKTADAAGDRPALGGRGGKHGRGGDRMGHGPLAMLHDLDLSDTQKESITKALDTRREANRPTDTDREAHRAKFETMRTEMKTRLATFAADRFDATAFTTPPAGLKDAPKHMGDHMAADLAVIVPLLTDAQRATLADRLETPAEHAAR